MWKTVKCCAAFQPRERLKLTSSAATPRLTRRTGKPYMEARGQSLLESGSEVSKDMLHDMPKRQSAALVAQPEDAIGEIVGSPATARLARSERRSQRRREKVVKPGALGMLLRPIGISI